MTINSANV